MRLPRIRRRLAFGGLLVAVVLGLGLAIFPRVVRARVAAEARRRKMTVRIGSVHLEPWGVRLKDVIGGLEGVEGIEIRAADVDVRPRLSLRGARVDVLGGELSLDGTQAVLRERLAAWRAAREPAAGAGHGADLDLSVHAMAVHWDGGYPGPKLEAAGVELETGPQGVRFGAKTIRVRAGPVEATASALSALVHGGSILRAAAGDLTVEWNVPADDDRPAPPSSLALPRAGGRAGAPDSAFLSPPDRLEPPLTAGPQADSWGLPDVRSLRAATAVVAAVLRDRVSPGAGVRIAELTWKVTRAGDPISLTVGPGPLVLERTSFGSELRFSTNPEGSEAAAFSFRAYLPTDGQDPTIGIEGGPIPLSRLGVREGAVGLVDVGETAVSGRVQLALAGDGSALTFDADGEARRLSIHSPRLASEIVRGLDVELRARGVLDAGGELRIDDFGAWLGAIQFGASGVVRQDADHVVASLHFGLPVTSCQKLLGSVPQAVLPALQGMKVEGTFGAKGRVAFDTRSLDDLRLDYDIHDSCTFTEVPAALEREQFQRPFLHRIYLPDGSIDDQWTGPGTPNWTPLDQISPYMQVAVLTTEDAAFRKHHGFSRASIRSSIIANLKAHRFVRGASTITMQVAKNLFLDREKTMARKLEEAVLAEYLEQTFSKDELMELYLNVIEFGPAIYGVTAAAEYYFGRTPAELNLAECFFLASLLPSPLRYGAMREAGEVPESWMRLLRSLLVRAHKLGHITDAELAEAEGETITFWLSGDRPAPRPPVRGRPLLDQPSDEDLGPPGE